MGTALLLKTDLVVALLTLGAESGITTGRAVILALAVVCLTIVMLSTHRRIRRSQVPSESPVAKRYFELKERRAATRDMEQVMLELDQLSRQIHGRLDTKLVRLEAVIRDADERIDRLSRLVRSAKEVPSLEVTLAEERPEQECEAAAEPRGTALEQCHHRYAVIYELADRGTSPLQIAEEVGKTDGEIELILALRKARDELPSVSDTAAPAHSDYITVRDSAGLSRAESASDR